MFIDIIFLLLMLVAVFKGYSKGFIVALFSVVAFIVGLAAALKLSALAAEKLSGTFNASGKWLPILSFLLVFIGVVLLIRVGAKIIQSSIELAMLGWVNRIAGIMLYALLYAILFSVFLFYAVQLQVFSVESIAASNVYPYIQPLGPTIIGALGTIIPWFKDMFSQLEHFFEGISSNSSTTPAP